MSHSTTDGPLVFLEFYLDHCELQRTRFDASEMSLTAGFVHSGATCTTEPSLRRFYKERGQRLAFMRISETLAHGKRSMSQTSWNLR